MARRGYLRSRRDDRRSVEMPKPVQIPSFMSSGTTVIELREFNDKKNNIDKMNFAHGTTAAEPRSSLLSETASLFSFPSKEDEE